MASQVSVLGSVSFGWLHEQGGFKYDEPFFMDPGRRLAQEQAAGAFVARRFPDEPIYNFEAGLVQVEGRRRPVALVGGIQPNLILGAAVGASLVFYDDRDPDITQTPLADVQDVDSLEPIDGGSTWPIDVFLRQIELCRRSLGATHAVIPPFFWDATGRATIHGILTTAQKLMGERIYLDMMDAPARVEAIFDWITELYCRLIQLFADAARLDVTGVHVGECSACMIGPEQFARFVLPTLNKLAERLGPLRLHSCGRSDHLLDVLTEVKKLHCLNVGSDTRVAEIRKRFGGVQIDIIPATRLLTVGPPAEVDAWVRQTLDENGGGPLAFHYHLDRGQPETNALQINRTLRNLGFHCAREEVY